MLDYEWVANAAKNGLQGADYGSAALGGVQIGMLEYRQSLSINSRVGTLPQFKIGYRRVGFASRALGRAGTAGSLLSTYVDYNSMQSGEISPARFSYRLGGTAASIIGAGLIGAELGGPYGALGGTAIGLIFVGGEMAYDGVVWFGNQLSQGMVRTENALKSGWYTGR
jgi:hypothetical protein